MHRVCTENPAHINVGAHDFLRRHGSLLQPPERGALDARPGPVPPGAVRALRCTCEWDVLGLFVHLDVRVNGMFWACSCT
jgi:hypothetical protein